MSQSPLQLRVAAHQVLDMGEPLTACIGHDDAAQSETKARYGWFDEQPAASGEIATVDAARLLPLPDDMDDATALRALAYWPAWRLTEAANLELGSRVLLIGEGWAAQSVLRLCGLRGCLQRTVAGPDELAAEAEQQFSEQKLSEPGALPVAPDALILLRDAARHLPSALAWCATKGTIVVAGAGDATKDSTSDAPVDLNLYSDAHKRGLRVTAMTLAPMAEDTANARAAGKLLASLARRGLLEEIAPPATL